MKMKTADGNMADAFERQTALDPERSFIVQAPAGSGKTELLMQRFLALLSTVDAPESILAMTFTRKAAAEMRSRITIALEGAAKGDVPEDGHRKKTFELAVQVLKRDAVLNWGLIETPGRLNISTIDSLCASLVRRMPLLSRMGRLPFISDQPDELYFEAAKRAIEAVEESGEDGECVRSALRHMDNSVSALVNRLVEMLKSRDQWLRHVKKGEEENDLKAELEASFERLTAHELEKARVAFPLEHAEAIFASARYAASNVDHGSPIKRLAGINAVPTTGADGVPLWHGLRKLLIIESGEKWRSPKGINVKTGFPAGKGANAVHKKVFQELLEIIEPNDNFFQALRGADGLPEPRFSEAEWSILSALLRLLPVAAARLTGVFAEKGVVDFQEMSKAALDSLGGDESPTDLMLTLDLQLRHILVDEYQDTSRVQLFLLRSLTRGWTPGDGRTLFVVGDPMQSIFGFREADVGLFIDAKNKGIGSVALAPLTLKTNFRSTPGIVNWVNASFAPSFAPAEDAFTGAVTYSPSCAFNAENACQGAVVTLFDGNIGKERRDKAEAERITEIVKGTAPGETVAVLCRSRVHLAETVNFFKKEGITYSAEALDPLTERPVIQDLLALSRALAHPFDRAAWLAVLRAPWCGLTLADLLHLTAGDKASPVFALVKDGARLSTLSQDGRERLERFTAKFEKALDLNGRMPFRRLIEGLWLDIGGPSCVYDDASLADAEVFFEAAGSVSRGGGVDVKLLEERVKSLYADKETAGSSVSLMTVHKAKGLEFDHVIIPGAGKRAKNGRKNILLWMERGEDLLLAPVEKKAKNQTSPLYSFLSDFRNKKIDLERTRLFYVACTRAKKRLYIFGHATAETIEETGDSFIKVDARSFLNSISHRLSKDMFIEGPAGAEAVAERQRPFFMLTRLSKGWSAPIPAKSIALDAPGEAPAENVEPEFYWAGETARHIGTAAHAYLCRIAKEGLENWSQSRIKSEAGRIKAMIEGLGLSRASAIKAADATAGILGRAITEERGRWALGAHADASVELPVTGVIEGAVVRAVIDRTFVENGVRWIIDYKTGSHAGGSVEDFLESEKKRYALQLERYALLLCLAGEKKDIKKGLYYPALSRFVEV